MICSIITNNNNNNNNISAVIASQLLLVDEIIRAGKNIKTANPLGD